MCRHGAVVVGGSSGLAYSYENDYNDQDGANSEEEGANEAILGRRASHRSGSALALSKVHLLLRVRFRSALDRPINDGDIITCVESHEIEVVAYRVVSKDFGAFEKLVALNPLRQPHSPGCEVCSQWLMLQEVGRDDSLRGKPWKEKRNRVKSQSRASHGTGPTEGISGVLKRRLK
jgi:hypothetical protein